MVWETLIEEEKSKDYFKALRASLAKVGDYCPPKTSVYRAMKLCPFDQVKVVILGQDPYHGGQANGLAFAVNAEFPVPPSLQNIFNEHRGRVWPGAPLPPAGELGRPGGPLAQHGPHRHQAPSLSRTKDFGWQRFTDRVIEELGKDPHPRVFILWGAQARSKKSPSSRRLALSWNPSIRRLCRPTTASSAAANF